MGADTKIEWAHHTFNPWIGCQKVGPACDHCDAETLATARLGVAWGPGAERRRTKPSTWAQPRRWDREAARLGIRYRVFCASLADVFDNAVPIEWRIELWELIASTPNLDWLLLTKRIGNAATMLPVMDSRAAGYRPWALPWPWPNVWIGATIANQAEADRDVPKLLATPAAKRFLSMEPLLGPVDLRRLSIGHHGQLSALTGKWASFRLVSRGGRTMIVMPKDTATLDWIIVGGESGPGARPIHPDWARSLRDQCAAAGVPFLFKQWGEWLPGENASHPYVTEPPRYDRPREVALWQDGDWGPRQTPNPARNYVTWEPDGTLHTGERVGGYWPIHRWASRIGKKAAGRLLDGVQHDGMPLPLPPESGR